MFIRLLLIGMLALAVVIPLNKDFQASADSSGQQVTHGEVLVPAGPRLLGGANLGACDLVGTTTYWAARVDVAFRFEVDPATWERPFVLEAEVPADLDIFFFGGARIWRFEERSLELEKGNVPQGSTRASVCLAAGGPVRFTYFGG